MLNASTENIFALKFQCLFWIYDFQYLVKQSYAQPFGFTHINNEGIFIMFVRYVQCGEKKNKQNTIPVSILWIKLWILKRDRSSKWEQEVRYVEHDIFGWDNIIHDVSSCVISKKSCQNVFFR